LKNKNFKSKNFKSKNFKSRGSSAERDTMTSGKVTGGNATAGDARNAIDPRAGMNPGKGSPGHDEPANRLGLTDTFPSEAPARPVHRVVAVAPLERPRFDPVRHAGRALRGVFAFRPLRLALCATRAIGVVLVAAGATGALASTASPDPARPDPVAASPETDRADDRRDSPAGNDARHDAHYDSGAVGGSAWEQDRRADEAALAERWPELDEAAEEAIKQGFRQVREQADQARRALEALGREMDQLHRWQHEELQARHGHERAAAAAEGAEAVEQADERHQQERAALHRDQKAERDRLAQAQAELDRHLEGARDDVVRAREEAGGDEAGGDEIGRRRTVSRLDLPEQPDAHQEPGMNEQPEAAAEPGAAAGPEEGREPVAAESGRESQDRQQQAAAAAEDPGDGEPHTAPRVLPQQAAPEPDGAPGHHPDVQEAAPPEAAEAAAASQDLADLVERGNAMLDFGDLASARLFYQRAAGWGSAEGAMLMGMTFDPLYFAAAGVHGTQPRIQDALEWYGKAIAMGSLPAQARMGRLRSWLEHSAAGGDAQAEAALQQLR
jgi:hypothetical protein